MNSKNREQREENYQRNNLRIFPERKGTSLQIKSDDQTATTITEESSTPKHIITRLKITQDREDPKSVQTEKNKVQTQVLVSESAGCQETMEKMSIKF